MDDIRNIYKERNIKFYLKNFIHHSCNLPSITLIITRQQKTSCKRYSSTCGKNKFISKELIIRTYLYRSVRNKCFTYLRNLKIQQHHEREITNNWQEQEEPIVLNNLIQEEVYRQLLASIDELPPQCKKICTLTLEGKKPSEIAVELGLAVDTVKKQKQIALKRLQDKLGILFLLYPMLYTHFTS